MISQQIGFSILTAPLAAIDRRSLSQAWYSALHLARPNPRSSRGQPSSNQVVCKREHRPNGETPHIVRPVQRPAGAVPKEHALRRGAPSPERRAERSPLARRIERAFLDPVRRTDRATFTLDGSRATSGSMTDGSKKDWETQWHEDVFALDDYHSAPDGSVGIYPPLPGVPYQFPPYPASPYTAADGSDDGSGTGAACIGAP